MLILNYRNIGDYRLMGPTIKNMHQLEVHQCLYLSARRFSEHWPMKDVFKKQ